MSNLDEFFSRYGSPAKEANERVDIYHTRADCIDNMRRITAEDRRAVREIAEMQKYIEVLKAYRKTLYERAQALCTAAYHLQLKVKRTIDPYHNKKWYTVSIAKIYEESGISPEITLEETYSGKERAAALKRFEKLKKQYPSIEHIKEIDKYKWER